MKKLNEKISVFFNLAKQKISKAREALTPKANELKEKTKTKIQQTGEYLAPKAEDLKEKAKTKIQQTGEYLAPKAEELKEKTKTKIQQTGEYLAPKAKELKEKAKIKIQQTGEYLAPKAEELKEKAKAKIQQTGEYLAPKVEKFIKYIVPITCLILLLFCTAFFSGIFSNNKNLYVISIGVPTYKNHYNMDMPRNQEDAERISDILRRAEGVFSNVYYETIAEHGMASNGNVEKAINRVYRRARKSDVVLIYISSHGKKHKDGEYLLLLYDFSKEKIYKTGFRAKNLIKEPKIKTIVWIDACESEAAAKDLIDNKVDLLVSSSENECPYSDWRGSAFTNTLLEGLSCRADFDKNGIVSLQEITTYVVKNVYGQIALNPVKRISDVDLVKCRY